MLHCYFLISDPNALCILFYVVDSVYSYRQNYAAQLLPLQKKNNVPIKTLSCLY